MSHKKDFVYSLARSPTCHPRKSKPKVSLPLAIVTPTYHWSISSVANDELSKQDLQVQFVGVYFFRSRPSIIVRLWFNKWIHLIYMQTRTTFELVAQKNTALSLCKVNSLKKAWKTLTSGLKMQFNMVSFRQKCLGSNGGGVFEQAKLSDVAFMKLAGKRFRTRKISKFILTD